MSSHSLLPSLTALLPPSSHSRFISHLSLQSLHVEPYHLTESIYTATSSVLPGQIRHLRIRERRYVSRGPQGEDGGDGDEDGDGAEQGRVEYSVVFLSPPLSGREYSETNVRACIALDVVGSKSREDVEAFVRNMGFQHSHTHTRSGLLFHLPLPPPARHMTLHLSVTRLALPDSNGIIGGRGQFNESSIPDSNDSSNPTGDPNAHPNPVTAPDPQTSEPYIVHLEPCRAVQAVVTSTGSTQSSQKTAAAAAAGGAGSMGADPGLHDMVKLLHEAAGRVEGVKWETGR